ncbi:unnamed protein product [Thelazia callipaeda]|uniref:RTP1_C1 domain-containing protein n=1 Tax=Thelazia callipaeda TaxID=103827 RepID=A0A158RBJ5_THECL|nr:unnamed protein product [Thelazia callipaeda]
MFQVLLDYVSAVSLPKVKRLPFDPLKHQTMHLERLMRDRGFIDSRLDEEQPLSCLKNYHHGGEIIKRVESLNAEYWSLPNLMHLPPQQSSAFITSSSNLSSSSVESTLGADVDYRIYYSYLMLYLLKKVVEILKGSCKTANNFLLSVHQLTIIETAFEFIIPTSVTPYVDKGVILHLGKSTLVKHWKPTIGDVEFRKQQLKKALDVFNDLMNSSDMIKNSLVRKFLAEYICLNEQLIKLGEKEHKEKYEKFILTLDRPMLITSLFILLTANKEQPKWLHVNIKKAVSKHITKLLLLENGLYHLITAVAEGANCFGNFGFVQSFSRILVTVPFKLSKDKYYQFLVQNFLVVLEMKSEDRKKTYFWFQKHPNAADAAVCFAVVLDLLPKNLVENIFDALLLPWENLKNDCYSIYPPKKANCFNLMLDKSLRILSFYAKALPKGMKLPLFHRFKALFNLWTVLYASCINIIEERKTEMPSDFGNTSLGLPDILYRIIDNPTFETVDEKADFIVRQIEDYSESYIPEFYFKSVLVEEVEQNEMDQNQNRNCHEEFEAKKDEIKDWKFGLEQPKQELGNSSTSNRNLWLQSLKVHYPNLQIHLTKPRMGDSAFIQFEKGILKTLQICVVLDIIILSQSEVPHRIPNIPDFLSPFIVAYRLFFGQTSIKPSSEQLESGVLYFECTTGLITFYFTFVNLTGLSICLTLHDSEA